jgi:hypothetical protein
MGNGTVEWIVLTIRLGNLRIQRIRNREKISYRGNPRNRTGFRLADRKEIP